MKSLFTWVLLAGLAAALSAGYRHHDAQMKQHAYQQDLAVLQQEFTQRASVLPFVPSASYTHTVHTLLESYAQNLLKLSQIHTTQYNPMREKDASVEAETEGRFTPTQAAARTERIAFTLKAFDNLIEGTYKPIASAADKNMRLDIVSIQPYNNGTTTLLKVEYLRWGPSENLQYNKVQGDIRTSSIKGSKNPEAAQILAEGQPPTLQINPQRWVKEYIPGTEIGYYELPLLPSNAEGITLSFDFTASLPGGETLPYHLVFEEIPTASPWKLSANTQWEAQEHVASQQD
jgi:hypothetical protein